MTFNSALALQYLHGQYNPIVGFCYEAPIGVSFENTFWTNDNQLAIHAFTRLGDMATANAILMKLQGIRIFGHDGTISRGYTDPYLVEANVIPFPVNGSQCYQINSTGLILQGPVPCIPGPAQGGQPEIWHGEANGALMWDEETYFNLACMRALCYHKQGLTTQRDQCVCVIEHFWDDQNWGFIPRGQTPASRKGAMDLALYVLTGAKCGWPPSFQPGRAEIVLGLLNEVQLANGGFSTGFTIVNREVDWTQSDTSGNTETTSLCVMALIQPANY